MVKMVYIKRSSLLLLLVLVWLYVTPPKIYMPAVKKQILITDLKPFSDEEIHNLENGFEDQVHPRLLQWIRTKWIIPPSTGPLNLEHPEKKYFSQYGQKKISDLLQEKKDGFFVECGALDGETASTTLYFERELNWTGLLIEADKGRFEKLQTKNRKAFSINSCLNSKNKSVKAKFGTGLGRALADEKLPTLKLKKFVTVQCFTLYSLMKALKRTKIDLFSLDVEGAELGILKTIPFSHLDIEFFLIEYSVYAGTREQADIRFKAMDSFLKPKGYVLVHKSSMDLYYRKQKNY